MTTDSGTEPTSNLTTEPAMTSLASAPTRRWFQQPAVIGVGAALGTLLLVGGTVAITLEIVEEVSFYSSDRAVMSGDGTGTVAATPADALPPENALATTATADAASLTSAIDRAVAAVDGVGASSVAFSAGLFEVDVLLANGREVEVYVAADGSVTADAVNNVDLFNDPAIDTSRLSAVIDAALAAVSAQVGQGGTVAELSTTSSPGRAFDVTVMLAGGNEVWLELADDLSVVEFDLD